LGFVLVVACVVGVSHAQALTIDVSDSSLLDWGVTPVTDWDPDTPSDGYLYHTVEDQTGYFLYPGFGGQDFDAEALYTYHNDTDFYFALVTGFRPEGRQGYAPGDLAIDFGSDGTYEFGIETTGNNGLTKGALYSGITWGKGLKNWGKWNGINANFNDYLGYPTEIESATDTEYTPAFQNLYYTAYDSDRYIIEGVIPHSYFEDYWEHAAIFTVHWTETCGNDVIELDGKVTPEPATFAMMILGLFGFFVKKKVNI
jgi:hypothetical protein